MASPQYPATNILPEPRSCFPCCATGPMEDWTGLDSLVSPAFSLLVFFLVCLIESRFPGVDILPFIPKVGQTTRAMLPCPPGRPDR